MNPVRSADYKDTCNKRGIIKSNKVTLSIHSSVNVKIRDQVRCVGYLHYIVCPKAYLLRVDMLIEWKSHKGLLPVPPPTSKHSFVDER